MFAVQFRCRFHECRSGRAVDGDAAACIHSRGRTADPRAAAPEAWAKGQDRRSHRRTPRAQRARPPTAKGFCFLALEDPDGMVNVVVPPAVYKQCRQAIQGAFVIVEKIIDELIRLCAPR